MERRVFDHRNIEVHWYESIQSILDYSKDHIDERFRYLQGSDFLGRSFTSVEDLITKINQPWEDGLEQLDRMLDELSHAKLPTPISRKRRLQWDPQMGDEIDLDRLRSGQDYWRLSRRTNTHGPATITIVTDIGTIGSVSHQKLLWRGAGAIVLTKLLEDAGYRVELWAANHARGVYEDSRSREFNCYTVIRLKRPQDPLDVVSFSNVVSAWFFRTIVFGNRVNSKRSTVFGGGSTIPTSEELVRLITPDQSVVHISNVWEYESAVRLIKETIESIQQPERSR